MSNLFNFPSFPALASRHVDMPPVLACSKRHAVVCMCHQPTCCATQMQAQLLHESQIMEDNWIKNLVENGQNFRYKILRSAQLDSVSTVSEESQPTTGAQETGQTQYNQHKDPSMKRTINLIRIRVFVFCIFILDLAVQFFPR